MSRRQVFSILPPSPEVEPEYDLYQELRREAELRSRLPLGRDDLRRMTDVAATRGHDWCTAVLGHNFPGLDHFSSIDGWLLVAADEGNLNPPLPRRIVEERRAAQVRPVGTPPPPSESQRELLQLVASGVVFTLRPRRGAPAIRVTSEPSHGTRGGALGRRVDAAVRRLQKRGWVVEDPTYRATETGHYGECWRLTESGTTALEG